MVGLFPPSVGGPSHKPRSSVAVSARSPGCQTACLGGAGISPYLECGGAGGTEWLLSTFDMWHLALGI